MKILSSATFFCLKQFTDVMDNMKQAMSLAVSALKIDPSPQNNFDPDLANNMHHY